MIPARVVLSALVALALAPGVAAYLKLGASVGDRVVGIQWTTFPIEYFITGRDDDRVSASELQAAVARAFDTWAAVPTASISTAFGGFTGAEPFEDDQMSVIGFQARPDMDRTLGAATFEIDTTTGRLISVDIFFNTIFDWSVAPGGESGLFDLESVAVHEIGHLLGLGHSALGETELGATGTGRRVLGKRAVMFPIAYPRGSIEDRTLEADDVAGLGDIYGSTEFNRTFGAIRGQVRLEGQGLFGAHVTAFNIRTGALVSGFSLTDRGEFVIAGLEPGLYVVRVEPLDDADADSFFSDEVDVNIDFRPAYHPSLVAVPAGGAGAAIDITVTAK